MRKMLVALAILLGGLLTPGSPVHAVSYYTCDAGSTSTPGGSNPYIAFWYIRSEIFTGVGGTYIRRYYTYYYSYIGTTITGSSPYISQTTRTVTCSKLLFPSNGGGSSGGW